MAFAIAFDRYSPPSAESYTVKHVTHFDLTIVYDNIGSKSCKIASIVWAETLAYSRDKYSLAIEM
jgi:hypothetical protein